jgi:NAD(P)H-quinone oxidoreductase subunit H
MLDMGAGTPFFYVFRERELIYDLWEAVTGYRMVNHNYWRIGGVAVDLPYGWLEKCSEFCDYMATKINEYERLISQNPIFQRRVEGVGIISREDAINWGLSGPMLRASGVQWDLRRVDHYECYDELDWDVQSESSGDCLARYQVRVREMRESIKILRQAIAQIPGGAYENLEAQRIAAGPKSEWNQFDYQFMGRKLAPTFKIPSGEHYVRIESGKGELGIFIQSHDQIFPWRWKIRAADFNNLQILPQLLKGVKVADIVVILGSIDIIMGSVDR